MKCIISNRLWLPHTASCVAAVTDQCTHRIELTSYEKMLATQRGGLPYRLIKTYSRPTKELLSFPVGKLDAMSGDLEFVDKRTKCELPTFPDFSETLRPSQQEALDFAMENGSIIIKARPGWGKTFTACAIAAKMKRKTLIVVHTIALLEQWVKEIKKVLGTTAGVVGDSTYVVGEYITVGLIKTLHKNRLALSKQFGLVIVDEVHHLPADTFIEFIDSSYAAVKIGMSGTLERTDKTHVIIYDYIASKYYIAPDENVMTPVVHIIRLPINFDHYEGTYVAKVSRLNEDPMYLRVLANLCLAYAKKSHKVLCVMDRVEASKQLAELIGDKAICYTHKTDDNIKATAFARMQKDADVLVGSKQIFSEGISEKYLSALVLGCSVKGPPLEQLIGRIERLCEDKQTPVIVDIRLEGKTMSNAGAERDIHYERKGYEISNFQI